MENKILISFILPIYNVEKYLNQAVESIEMGNESLSKTIEVVLVNDGSTDSSELICMNLKRKYKNIIYLKKENGGLSDARNYGLIHARGKYVFFLDSDDYIAENCVKYLVENVEKYNEDIFVWDAIQVDDRDNIINDGVYKFNHAHLSENIYTGESFIKNQLVDTGDYPSTVWLGMYNRNFLLNNNLFFKKGILHEDELWTPMTYLESNSIRYLKKDIYIYRIRENSIMTKKSKSYFENLRDLIYIYNLLPNYFNYKINDKQLLKLIKENNSKRYLHALYKFQIHEYKELKGFINPIIILKNDISIKNYLKTILLLLNSHAFDYICNKLGG